MSNPNLTPPKSQAPPTTNTGHQTAPTPRSPKITHISWGSITINDQTTYKDVKVFPSGSREWDWREYGTRHDPGITPPEVQDLLARGCKVVVLSRGMQSRLKVMPEAIRLLETEGVDVFVDETKAAVARYNSLVDGGQAVGGLFHSTC